MPHGANSFGIPGILALMVGSSLVCPQASRALDNPVIIAAFDWTVTADQTQRTLNISNQKLGIVIQDVQLNVRVGNTVTQLADWTITGSQHELSIRTARPKTAWLLNLGSNTLQISCTSADALLTAEAPASPGRVVVRAIDPEGVPVSWVGTDEVRNGYGGSETRNSSFLPNLNPDVMYFRLGQVSGSGFHNLFDRKSDTLIAFSPQTAMQRNRRDQDLLDITIPVPGSTVIRLTPHYFTRVLGVPFYIPFDDSHFSKAPAMWGSLTSYYAEVTEADIVRNTDWIAGNLLPYGFQYVELDEGYDGSDNFGESVGKNHNSIGEWDRQKFPHGPKWLAGYIKSKGLHAGIWMVPNAYAVAVKQHPDWYLRDKQGKIVLDYNTPALDSTNPEVLAFLKEMFRTLDGWGFEYYKFDGEHALPAYIPAVDRSRLYDKTIDPVMAYRNRLQLIRETVGPEVFIEGCPAGTPLNGIGYFNSYFNGQDVYNSWQGMYALFSSINANAFLNHMVVYVMPGEGIELTPPMTVEEARRKRPPSLVQTAHTREDPMVGFGTTLAEARTLVAYLSLTGVAYPVASVMPELPDERIGLLKMTLPTMPIFPIDLFSRGTDAKYTTFRHTQPDYYIHNYPEILDLKVNARSGIYDVVGFTNWRSDLATKEISLSEKLGLAQGSRYITFDFWQQRLLGVFDDRIKLDIQPHDTRVLFIHPDLNRPQLVGTSRHITGAYSILDLAWDDSRNSLHGSSQGVSGEPYTLRIYVPDGTHPLEIRAAAAGQTIPVQHVMTGDLLSVTFAGHSEPVKWEVRFAQRSTR
jgi:Melibiase